MCGKVREEHREKMTEAVCEILDTTGLIENSAMER